MEGESVQYLEMAAVSVGGSKSDQCSCYLGLSALAGVAVAGSANLSLSIPQPSSTGVTPVVFERVGLTNVAAQSQKICVR